ncbi:hypothetical protein ElyMa_006543800 [Elysia marginata]|uniref:Reverse transcriptase domain-containing protein n=1 Tax=Elysia marginata TaxID=1093978 RepID=A0AAV4I7M7_9GAST|nr:hypothetical protein ElyMa_006543800 [Elysia marginata]
MTKFGCLDRSIQMVSQFHDGMQAQVLDDGEPSDPFPVSSGVKQGCVLAPTLFSMMVSVMLTDAFSADTLDIDIRYRTYGKLYNPQSLQAKNKVQTDRIQDFLFVDGCALNAGNEADMQHSMNLFSTACDNFGLTISSKKTEVKYQPAPKRT